MALRLSACAVTAAKSTTRSTTQSISKFYRPKKMLLAVAISAALTPLTMAQAAQKEPMKTQQTQQLQFTIASGELEQVLTAFGQQAGIILIFSTELTRGVNSQGLRGTFNIEQGFATLLKNTDLNIYHQGSNKYSLQKKSTTDTVHMLATTQVHTIKSGGYAEKNSSASSKMNTPLMETARTVNVVTRDFIEMQAIQTVEGALRYTSGVLTEATGQDLRYQSERIRGFAPSYYIDGMRKTSTGSYSDIIIDPQGVGKKLKF